MTQRAILDGLWCGQGMANALRVFNDASADPATTPADYLCLFDFGSGGLSASKKVLGITPPVEFIIDQLKLQMSAGRTPTLELLLISHQDRDHWFLLRELEVQLVEQGIPLVVNQMILAGANWRDSSRAVVDNFARRTPDRKACVTWYDEEHSSYSQYLIGTGIVTSVGDVAVRMLVTNVAVSNVDEDIERNASSAVVLLELGQLSFILPGDATWQTFARLRQIMDKWRTNPLPYVYAASVPHHGALRTMNRSSSTVTPDLSELEWFTYYTKPVSIYASAGIANTHSHPYDIILRVMGRYTSAQQFQARPVVSFSLEEGKFQLTPEVTNNIYTTVLNLQTPAITANWIFDITPSTHDTRIQLFEAGIPGILEPPQISPWVLDAQRAEASRSDYPALDDDVEMPDTLVPSSTGPGARPAAPRAPIFHPARPTMGASAPPDRRLPAPALRVKVAIRP